MKPQLLPFLFAVVAMLWAALLAMCEGVLAANPQVTIGNLPKLYAEKPERLRRALSIGRISLLTLAALALSGSLRWWNLSIGLASLWLVGLIVFIILVADLLPRLLGLWRGPAIGRDVVRTAGATLALPAPLFVAAGIIDRGFARMFGVSAAPTGPSAEIAQREMLLGVFALADTMVSEVMTPRIDMVAVDRGAAFEDVVKQAAAAEFSRLPVYDEDVDNIVGVLYAKDLLSARFGTDASGSNWRDLVRPVEIVPEVKTLDRQLRDFQRGPTHLAIVVDEFGGTAGIVTLEDVLEEIVGEIADEYDDAQGPPISEVSPGVFEVDGRAPLELLAESLGVPIEHEEVTTAGGFIYAALGHVPTAGETIEVAGCKVTVEKVVKRAISRLRFEKCPPPGAEAQIEEVAAQ